MIEISVIVSWIAIFIAGHATVKWRRNKLKIRRIAVESLDEDGRLLPSSGVFHSMVPELRRAAAEKVSMAVVLFTVYGSDMRAASLRLAANLRKYERAYELDGNEILLALRGVDQAMSMLAVSRLGSHIESPGCRVVDAAVTVINPGDSCADMDALVADLRRRSRPIQEFVDWSVLNRDSVLALRAE
jgi:hypothetical protein